VSYLKLILRSLWFFRKQHLAVMAGTLISTAVLTGALIIGDSVMLSLKNLVEIRLGDTHYALQTGDLKVGALVAVNCLGDVIDPLTDERLAGLLNEDLLNLADTGNRPTRVSIKVKPTILVGAMEINYPGYFTVKHDFTSGDVE